MILVDTSVWIDFLKNRKTLAIDRLLFFLEKEETILYTGLILQELLQGCRKESDCLLIENHFQSFIEIFPQKTTYRLAAKIYRDAKNKGFTIRSSIDCLISACAIEHKVPVLQQDRDYLYIQKISSLKIA